MEAYISQLIEDIESAIANVPRPYIPPQGVDFRDIPTPEEEERSAPKCVDPVPSTRSALYGSTVSVHSMQKFLRTLRMRT